VAAISEDGAVRLLGRVKRFAKIGGEMVSLTAVEDLVLGALPGAKHAVVSVPDPRKGERLVLVTDHPAPDVSVIAAYAREQGAPELAVPKRLVRAPEVPVLGSGKTDYVTIQRMAEEAAQEAAA
jgi:acyl-[acyl-carrier-protein]-phospholipid O-acyltransferase/long-chain-fatty-acid--[acyl-carrier-protein] ligase